MRRAFSRLFRHLGIEELSTLLAFAPQGNDSKIAETVNAAPLLLPVLDLDRRHP
jgi:hypothetical protein